METWGYNKTETKVLTANYFTPLLSIKYTGFLPYSALVYY